MSKRPVYIFSGESCLCKSHIAALTGKKIFETDQYDALPDTIDAEIVVLGRRNKEWIVEDIISRVCNPTQCKIISVNFSEVG